MNRVLKWFGGTSNDTLKLGDLTGKTAIVTGANSGLGYGISKLLAKQNSNVILGNDTDI